MSAKKRRSAEDCQFTIDTSLIWNELAIYHRQMPIKTERHESSMEQKTILSNWESFQQREYGLKIPEQSKQHNCRQLGCTIDFMGDSLYVCTKSGMWHECLSSEDTCYQRVINDEKQTVCYFSGACIGIKIESEKLGKFTQNESGRMTTEDDGYDLQDFSDNDEGELEVEIKMEEEAIINEDPMEDVFETLKQELEKKIEDDKNIQLDAFHNREGRCMEFTMCEKETSTKIEQIREWIKMNYPYIVFRETQNPASLFFISYYRNEASRDDKQKKKQPKSRKKSERKNILTFNNKTNQRLIRDIVSDLLFNANERTRLDKIHIGLMKKTCKKAIMHYYKTCKHNKTRPSYPHVLTIHQVEMNRKTRIRVLEWDNRRIDYYTEMISQMWNIIIKSVYFKEHGSNFRIKEHSLGMLYMMQNPYFILFEGVEIPMFDRDEFLFNNLPPENVLDKWHSSTQKGLVYTKNDITQGRNNIKFSLMSIQEEKQVREMSRVIQELGRSFHH